METPFDTTLLKILGIDGSSNIAAAITARSDLFELTESSYTAALFPNDPGILTHSQRAAIATRICIMNNEPELAVHYKNLVSSKDDLVICNIDQSATDPRMSAIVNHVDVNARDPKINPQMQIEKLKSNGLSDTEIVSIFAVIAFVSHQLRVAKGLRVMKEVL